MKIAHIVSTFPPYHGGMGNSVAGMAAALADRGHEVVIITPQAPSYLNGGDGGGTSTQNLTPTPLLLGEGEGEVSMKRLRPWLRWGNAAFLPQLLWNLQGYDIVHLHYPFFGGAEVVAFWKQFVLYPKLAPLVVTYHMDALADGWKGKFFAWHNRHMLPWMLRAADRVIVTSRDYADHSLLQRIPEVAGKISIVPLGVDANAPMTYGGDQPEILFVGALDRAHAFKGVDVLLRAFKVVFQFWGGDVMPRLVIVGDGDLRAEYEKTASELGIRELVTFVGRVTDDTRAQLYADASLVVLPSISQSEAFGMVLLEAMAAGRATIASNLPGVRSVVVDGMTGVLVKPGDIVGLGKTIVELLKDPEKCASMGRAGRSRVAREYTWESVGEKLETVYQSLTVK